jgi:hypothetical protein
MSRYLSKENVDIVEEFIQSNKPTNDMPNISEKDREQTIADWKNINEQETPCNSYLQFANNANGMISYGFYKTTKGEIYIVESYCSVIRRYYNTYESWIMLMPYEEFIKKLF